MAEKRMFAKSIVLSDAFLDMPMSARCLYFTLSMLADDDGFVGAPKSIMRQCGASQDDLLILIGKRFVLTFDSGVIVIKHWRINNYLRQDRYSETTYQEEKATLTLDAKGAYTELGIPGGIPGGIPSIDKIREDKVSIEKTSKENKNNCTEPPKAPSVLAIPLVDGTDFEIFQDDIDEWKDAFPNVDICQQLKAIKLWCKDNPTRRKTRKGVRRFITGWLDKEQNRGGARSQPTQAPKAPVKQVSWKDGPTFLPDWAEDKD